MAGQLFRIGTSRGDSFVYDSPLAAAVRRHGLPVRSQQPERTETGKSMTAGTPRFTPLQGQYLAFIRAYSILNRRPPAEADMQRFFRVTAPSVHQMVVTLEARRLVARDPGKGRSIRVLAAVEDLPALVER